MKNFILIMFGFSIGIPFSNVVMYSSPISGGVILIHIAVLGVGFLLGVIYHEVTGWLI